MGDIIVLAVLAVIICLVVRFMVKNHKRGGCCSGCSGNCSGCSARRVGQRELSSDK